jgi:hypothetical protein
LRPAVTSQIMPVYQLRPRLLGVAMLVGSRSHFSDNGCVAVASEAAGCLDVGWAPRSVSRVTVVHYKPVGRGFESRWCHWNFSLT